MKNLFTPIALVCALTFGFTSCSKDDNTPTIPDYQANVMVKDGETIDLAKASKTKNTEGTISRKGKVYSLRDFRQFSIDEEGITTTTPDKTYFFDFKENDGSPHTDFIASMSGTTSVTFSTNDEKGYTLSFIDKNFDLVTANDQFTAIEDNTSAIHKMTIPPGVETERTAAGWCNYNAITHIVSAVENRTLIVSKERKPYFKIRINSIYSNGEPNTPEKASNMMFYSIDYQEFI